MNDVISGDYRPGEAFDRLCWSGQRPILKVPTGSLSVLLSDTLAYHIPPRHLYPVERRLTAHALDSITCFVLGVYTDTSRVRLRRGCFPLAMPGRLFRTAVACCPLSL